MRNSLWWLMISISGDLGMWRVSLWQQQPVGFLLGLSLDSSADLGIWYLYTNTSTPLRHIGTQYTKQEAKQSKRSVDKGSGCSLYALYKWPHTNKNYNIWSFSNLFQCSNAVQCSNILGSSRCFWTFWSSNTKKYEHASTKCPLVNAIICA